MLALLNSLLLQSAPRAASTRGAEAAAHAAAMQPKRGATVACVRHGVAPRALLQQCTCQALDTRCRWSRMRCCGWARPASSVCSLLLGRVRSSSAHANQAPRCPPPRWWTACPRRPRPRPRRGRSAAHAGATLLQMGTMTAPTTPLLLLRRRRATCTRSRTARRSRMRRRMAAARPRMQRRRASGATHALLGRSPPPQASAPPPWLSLSTWRVAARLQTSACDDACLGLTL